MTKKNSFDAVKDWNLRLEICIVAICAYSLASSTTLAQPALRSSPSIPLYYVTQIRVGIAGEVIVRRTSRMSWDVEFLEKQVLESEYGQEQLDVLPEQRSSLKKILTRYDQIRDAALEAFTTKHYPGIDAKLSRQLLQARAAALVKIEDELLPLQMQRLRELVLRWRIRRDGMCHVLLGEWSRDLALTPQQGLAIMQEAASRSEWLAKEMRGRRRAVLNDLFSELKPRQKEKLKQEMGPLLYGPTESLDLLCHQLSYRTPNDRRVDVGHELLAGVRLPMVYVVELDGTWKNFYPELKLNSLAIALLEVLGNDDAQRAMRLTEEQIELVDTLRSDYETEKRNRIGAKYPASFFATVPEGSVTHKAAVEWMISQERKLRKVLATNLLSLLADSQKAALNRLSRQCMALRRGYVAEFLDGELGNVLGLSDNQKTRIAKRAGRLRSDLVDTAAKWETEVHNAILRRLESKQRLQIGKKLGRPLADTAPALSVLMYDLRNPSPSPTRRER